MSVNKDEFLNEEDYYKFLENKRSIKAGKEQASNLNKKATGKTKNIEVKLNNMTKGQKLHIGDYEWDQLNLEQEFDEWLVVYRKRTGRNIKCKYVHQKDGWIAEYT